MKLFYRLLVSVAVFGLFCLTIVPVIALADGPGCFVLAGQTYITGTYYITIEDYYTSSYQIMSNSAWNAIADVGVEDDVGPDCDPVGELSPDGTNVTSITCGEGLGFGHAVDIDISIGTPLSGTTEIYNISGLGSNTMGFYCDGQYEGDITDSTPYTITGAGGCSGLQIGNGRVSLTKKFYGIRIECNGEYEPDIGTCLTVDDFHFTDTITDTPWLLSGSASIADSIMTLPPGDAAAQNLSTLASNTAYNAVISVTVVATDSSLDVSLVGTQNVVLAGAGLYTVPFVTNGVTATYEIQNHVDSDGDVEIDYTCLYPAASDSTEIVCLAPTNGEFDTADNWDWYYGAAWNPSGRNAYLPYNDIISDTGKSLVQSSGVYSLPIITDTYLILAFESIAQGQQAVVSTRVGDNWQEFEVNSSLYRYEADISSQAGITAAAVSFVNAGAPESEFAAVDDLTVDNVCIFVSDTPPNIPSPTNPWLDPFDFGFDYGCNDVPALLMGYGIDVYTPADTYNAGVATWTEENWVPWLSGALWMNVGRPISCFLVEFMRLVVGIAQQFINNYTNVINWNYETLIYGVPWLQEGLSSMSANPIYWFNWYANSLQGVIFNAGGNMSASTNWNRAGFIELQNSSAQNTIAVGQEVGSAISQMMDVFIWMWNESVIPWMGFTAVASNTSSVDESTGESLLDLFLWIIDVVGSILNLIWSILSWLAGLFTMAGDVPVEVYHSVRDGISSDAYTAEVACVDSNFWCYFWAGVYLVNETTGQTIAYPIIIVGLIIVTLVVVIRNVFAMFMIDIG